MSRWGGQARGRDGPAIVFFADRAIGVALFETAHVRWLLLAFPNVFENWWLYCMAVERFFPAIYQ